LYEKCQRYDINNKNKKGKKTENVTAVFINTVVLVGHNNSAEIKEPFFEGRFDKYNQQQSQEKHHKRPIFAFYYSVL
jgi:hypothetical protein